MLLVLFTPPTALSLFYSVCRGGNNLQACCEDLDSLKTIYGPNAHLLLMTFSFIYWLQLTLILNCLFRAPPLFAQPPVLTASSSAAILAQHSFLCALPSVSSSFFWVPFALQQRLAVVVCGSSSSWYVHRSGSTFLLSCEQLVTRNWQRQFSCDWCCLFSHFSLYLFSRLPIVLNMLLFAQPACCF